MFNTLLAIWIGVYVLTYYWQSYIVSHYGTLQEQFYDIVARGLGGRVITATTACVVWWLLHTPVDVATAIANAPY